MGVIETISNFQCERCEEWKLYNTAHWTPRICSSCRRESQIGRQVGIDGWE